MLKPAILAVCIALTSSAQRLVRSKAIGGTTRLLALGDGESLPLHAAACRCALMRAGTVFLTRC
jgi:hypothetical protein